MLKLVETKYQNVQTGKIKRVQKKLKSLLCGEYRIRTGGLLHAMQAL